jgi:hypothetical protein
LRNISLQGTPAISFNPDTFRHTPELFMLELGMHVAQDVSFIPPPEEFEIISEEGNGDSGANGPGSPPSPMRPVWAWDWELPKLTILRLVGEFAYRFQFKMLNGTPNLVTFMVNSNSSSPQHSRSLSLSDMVKPGYQHPYLDRMLEIEQQQRLVDDSSDNDETWQDFDYIHVPKLKTFTLVGRWTLDSRALNVLFEKVAPGISELSMSSRGHRVDEWVRLSSLHLRQLESAFHRVHTTTQVLSDAGLTRNTAQLYGGTFMLVEPPEWHTRPVKYSFLLG